MSAPIRSAPLSRSQDRISTQMSRLRSALAKAAFQGTSGQKTERISDAPAIWANVHNIGDALLDQDTWKSNALRANSLLQTADDALGQSTNVLRKAHEIAVRMSNGSMSADDRIAAAEEVDGLVDDLRAQGNADFGGRYVFAGTAYDAAPFDATNAYLGSTDIPSTLLTADESVDIGLNGDTVFTPGLAAIEDLATALRTGLQANVQGTLTGLDTAIDTTIATRASVGTKHKSAIDTLELSDTMRVNLQTALDEQLAADPTEVFQRLAELQTTYEATVAVTASSQQMRSLMERI